MHGQQNVKKLEKLVLWENWVHQAQKGSRHKFQRVGDEPSVAETRGTLTYLVGQSVKKATSFKILYQDKCIHFHQIIVALSQILNMHFRHFSIIISFKHSTL